MALTKDQISAVRTGRNCGLSWQAAAQRAGVSYFRARTALDPQWAAYRRERVNLCRSVRRAIARGL